MNCHVCKSGKPSETCDCYTKRENTSVFDGMTIDEMKIELARCHRRLEIDYMYDMSGNPIHVPLDLRSSDIDGISCREATIRIVEYELDFMRRVCEVMAYELSKRQCGYCHDTGVFDDKQEYSVPTTCTFCPPLPKMTDIKATVKQYEDRVRDAQCGKIAGPGTLQ